jgi:hypothetical protein
MAASDVSPGGALDTGDSYSHVIQPSQASEHVSRSSIPHVRDQLSELREKLSDIYSQYRECIEDENEKIRIARAKYNAEKSHKYRKQNISTEQCLNEALKSATNVKRLLYNRIVADMSKELNDYNALYRYNVELAFRLDKDVAKKYNRAESHLYDSGALGAYEKACNYKYLYTYICDAIKLMLNPNIFVENRPR